MKPKQRLYLLGMVGILFGLCILFVIYGMFRSELSLRKYEKDFLRVAHPQGTALIDSFGLEANYYPATYADDSIRFIPVYLVGELRSYIGEWRDIQNFYAEKILQDGELKTLQVMVLPVEIQSSGQKTSIKFVADYSYAAFEYDMLQSLQPYYHSKGIPQEGTGRKLYLVYVTPDL